MIFQSPSALRSAALRGRAFSFAKAISFGWKSGL